MLVVQPPYSHLTADELLHHGEVTAVTGLEIALIDKLQNARKEHADQSAQLEHTEAEVDRLEELLAEANDIISSLREDI